MKNKRSSGSVNLAAPSGGPLIRMRCLLPLFAGAVVALVTGCSSIAPAAAPISKPVTSSMSADSTCDLPIVAVLNSTSEKSTLTAIRRVTDRGATSTTLLDSPATARIDWNVPPPGWVQSAHVEEAIQASVESPITGQAGTVADVDRNLQSIAETNTHIGYAGVDPVSIDIMVTCSNIPRFMGTVHTWKTNETGAITCAQNSPSGDGAELARRAQQLYCNS